MLHCEVVVLIVQEYKLHSPGRTPKHASTTKYIYLKAVYSHCIIEYNKCYNQSTQDTFIKDKATCFGSELQDIKRG